MAGLNEVLLGEEQEPVAGGVDGDDLDASTKSCSVKSRNKPAHPRGWMPPRLNEVLLGEEQELGELGTCRVDEHVASTKSCSVKRTQTPQSAQSALAA